MEITFREITLRPWQYDDAHDLASIANNRKVSCNLRDGFPYPYSVFDAYTWLGNVIPANNPTKFFAITWQGQLAGSIGLVAKDDIYRKNMETGYFIGESFWGKGIATASIIAATAWAFREFDIVRMYAEPFADNAGSRKALENAGYRCEAVFRKNVVKLDQIKDSCIYSLLREDHVPDPNIKFIEQ